MAETSFIEMIKSFPDDLLASIQYVFDKLFGSSNNKDATKPSQQQQNSQSVSYTINTLPNINVSLSFPAFNKDEIFLPYDDSYGSAELKDDSKTVVEYVNTFLQSNRILQTYPVGSIVFSLFPLSDGNIDISNYNGYKLVPLGNSTTTTLSTQFT